MAGYGTLVKGAMPSMGGGRISDGIRKFGENLKGWQKNLQKKPGAMPYAYSKTVKGLNPPMPAYNPLDRGRTTSGMGNVSSALGPTRKGSIGITKPKFQSATLWRK